MFPICTQSGYYYCTDGNCYTTNHTSSTMKCTNNFTNFLDPSYPSTYSYNYSISTLPIVTLPVQSPNQTWVQINQGQSIRLNLQSVASKSSYINIAYSGL